MNTRLFFLFLAVFKCADGAALGSTANAEKALNGSFVRVWTGDMGLYSTAPQTPRKPSAARGRSATYPRLSAQPGADRGRRSDSPPARPAVALSVRQDSTATAAAPRLHSNRKPQPSPASAVACRHRTASARPGLPRTRCSRAPSVPHRKPAVRRATTLKEPPRATRRPSLLGGTERGSRRAGRPAKLAPQPGERTQ